VGFAAVLRYYAVAMPLIEYIRFSPFIDLKCDDSDIGRQVFRHGLRMRADAFMPDLPLAHGQEQ